MRTEAVRDLVQRAYLLEAQEDAWLAGLAESAEQHFGEAKGSVAMIFEAPKVRIRATASAGMKQTKGLHRIVEETFTALSSAYVRKRMDAGHQALTGTAENERPLLAWLERFGARDMLAIIGLLPSGIGASVVVNLPRQKDLGARTQMALAHLGAHMAAALQLRSGGDCETEATFGLDGTPLEAVGEALENEARIKLRDAVLAYTEVRSRGGTRALREHTCRVDARWSVLTAFEKSGEEYIVAKRNRPWTPAVSDLTQREREVATHLALGHSPKLVAYELGIAASTVRVLAARAARKLGVSSTAELSARLRQSADRDRSPNLNRGVSD